MSNFYEVEIKRIHLQLSETDKYLCSYLLYEDEFVHKKLERAWFGYCLLMKETEDPLVKLFWIFKRINCYHFHSKHECYVNFEDEKNFLKKLLVVYGYQYLMDDELIEILGDCWPHGAEEFTLHKYLEIFKKNQSSSLYKKLLKNVLKHCNDEVREFLKKFSKGEIQFDTVDKPSNNENRSEVDNLSILTGSSTRKERTKVIEKYTTKRNAKNICYIFYDENNRKGNDKDLKKVEECFQGTLNYKVKHIKLKDWKTLQNNLNKISKTGKQSDLFIGVFMCHGKQDQITINDENVNICSIYDYFKAEKAPFFRNKPKLFFLQCCSGTFLNRNLDGSESPIVPVKTAPKPPKILNICDISGDQIFVQWKACDQSTHFTLEINDTPDDEFREIEVNRTSKNLVTHIEKLNTNKNCYAIRIQAHNEFGSSLRDETEIKKPKQLPIEISPVDSNQDGYSGPNTSDIFLLYSTIPHNLSVRKTDTGSLFIQGFMDLIQKHYEQLSINEICNKYNSSLPKFSYEDNKFVQLMRLEVIGGKKNIHLRKSCTRASNNT